MQHSAGTTLHVLDVLDEGLDRLRVTVEYVNLADAARTYHTRSAGHDGVHVCVARLALVRVAHRAVESLEMRPSNLVEERLMHGVLHQPFVTILVHDENAFIFMR